MVVISQLASLAKVEMHRNGVNCKLKENYHNIMKKEIRTVLINHGRNEC